MAIPGSNALQGLQQRFGGMGGLGGIPGMGMGAPIVPGQGQTPPPGFASPLGMGGGMGGGPTMTPGGTGAPVMLQPGQMPTNGENFQYQGFPPIGGMQPGVTQPPQFLGPPVSAPPSGLPTGTPTGTPGSHPNTLGGVNNALANGNMPPQAAAQMQAMQQFRQAIDAWIQQRPAHPQGPIDQASMQAFHQQMQAWHQARPSHPMMGGMNTPPGIGSPVGGPVMTPGGGTTGAPLQGTIGMVPGVPGSMGLNPAATGTSFGIPAASPYQLPTYGG